MPADSELTEHALNSSYDFYELLGISQAASEAEIRRAYRQTALKYHPDKVGADQEKLDKFHLLQIAYDVLSDSTARQIHDNALRAKEEKKQREQLIQGRRRDLKEDLERRESAGAAELKRKRGEAQEEDELQRELKRLAADGRRRVLERQEKLRREAAEEEERLRAETESRAPQNHSNVAPQVVDEIDRTIIARCLKSDADAATIDRDCIMELFSRFGKIEHAFLKTKKVKEEGKSHRREYTVAFIVFASIVGAHAAVTDFPSLKDQAADGIWKILKDVNWAGGKQPDCIPQPKPKPADSNYPRPESQSAPSTPKPQKDPDGLRRVPSFGSFKGTPKAAASSPSMEELTLIRLRNAERKRLAEKLRKEDEEEEKEAQRDASVAG